MKPFKSLFCLIATLGVLAFASCGQRHPKYVIGVSQCSEDVWRDKLNNELRIAAFSANDVDLRISSADDDVALQTQQIDKFAEMGVDLLIVAPGQMKVSGAIERAYDKGIPVIVFDRRTHSNKYTAFIGADNEEMGRNMARYLSSQVKGNGRVLEICGLYTSSPSIARRRGFDMEAAQHNNLQIVEHIECDWTEQQAYRQMDSLLSAPHAAFNYVFAHNDRMAIGASEAARAKGRRDIRIIGIDAAPNIGIRAVADSVIDATFLYPTEGHRLVQTALAILKGEPYDRETILPVSSAVDLSNADILLLQNETLRDHYNVLTAANGKEGCKMAARHVPDLIVCDVMMPVMDGLECCRLIKGETVTSHIPVLMLTACSLDEQRVQGYDSGADGYLSKPFGSDVLLSRCRSLIENRRRIKNPAGALPHPSASAPASAAPPPSADLDSEFYRRFLEIFQAEMGRPELSVDAVAAQMGMERSQFYRKIKALTNYAPVELMRRLRLQQGHALLLSTDKTIGEIAYEIGFSSPAYFTKCYRDAYGVTPTQARGKIEGA